ncbi:glycosyltransferase involved in cell wall biosynthesis [Bradyrhizobium sp. GM5.1]
MGKEKCDFYRSIDVFAFPTTYINEAQPTVVYEALTAGIPVIAYGRGCILSQVRGSGLVIPPTDAFVTPALAWLRDYAANRGRFKREMIASEMMAAHEGERKRAKSALLQIASPSKYIPSG